MTKSMWTALSSARKRLCSAKESVEFPVGCGLDSAAREPEKPLAYFARLLTFIGMTGQMVAGGDPSWDAGVHLNM